MTRPSFTGAPQKINYGDKFTIAVLNLGHATKFKGNLLRWSLKTKQDWLDISIAVIMDLGFHTHGVSLDSKYVGLVSTYNSTTNKLTITSRE